MDFKMLFAGMAAFFLSVAAVAQPAPPAPGEPAFSADAFRAHVVHLADDRLEGREAGTPGYDLAASYVAGQFRALALRPAMAGGEWFQPIRFLRYRIVGTPRLSVAGRNFPRGPSVTFRPTPEAGPVRFEAPAVFAGFGLDAPGQGADDYEGLDVRGKIVVILSGTSRNTTRNIPSDVGAHLISSRRRMAAARGAIGLIEISARAMQRPRTAPAAAAAAGRPGASWVDDDGRAHSDSPGLRFNATIDAETARAMFPGASERLDAALEQARDGGSPRGFDLGVIVGIDQRSVVAPFSSPNVLAVIPGTDPALAGEYVLLMAHLDGLGIRDRRTDEAPGTDRIRNGAMDNATGIATLIEVARAMIAGDDRPRRPILLAAVTAEEIGLLGAGYLARHVPVDGRIVSVVNLDMPILTYDFQDVTAFGAEHSTMGPIVARAAARMGVALAADPLPQQGLFVRSDHYRFVLEGVPSVFLMTGFANGGRERFQGFLQGAYHSPSDDLAQPFDWQAGARFVRLNYLIAREIADGDGPPLWYSDSYFGGAFGGDRRRATRSAQ